MLQDSDCKKSEKRESSGPPLQTASISVRALIEEKIIQKRNTNPALSLQNQTNVSTSSKSGFSPPFDPLGVNLEIFVTNIPFL